MIAAEIAAMQRAFVALASAAGFAAAVLLSGCDASPTAPPLEIPGNAAPNFGLMDVNPASPTGGLLVSPRDHVGKVSAWYFGHAT